MMLDNVAMLIISNYDEREIFSMVVSAVQQTIATVCLVIFYIAILHS